MEEPRAEFSSEPFEPQLSPEDLREIDRAYPEPGMGCPSPHLSLTLQDELVEAVHVLETGLVR